MQLNKIISPIMPSINSLLDKCSTPDEKHELMHEIFNNIKNRVNELLSFGPCNNQMAQYACSAYYYNHQKRNNFSPIEYSLDECKALPAVIANILSLEKEKKQIPPSAQERFEQYFASGYLYGTGTCEVFAIIGAYILATEFDVKLSIETIYSNESHTYIRLHTTPEYIFDFWGAMICPYDDQISWNEYFGEQFIRDEGANFETELVLNNKQLIDMGQRVLSDQNVRLRAHIHHLVQERVSIETKQVILKDKVTSLSNC